MVCVKLSKIWFAQPPWYDCIFFMFGSQQSDQSWSKYPRAHFSPGANKKRIDCSSSLAWISQLRQLPFYLLFLFLSVQPSPKDASPSNSDTWRIVAKDIETAPTNTAATLAVSTNGRRTVSRSEKINHQSASRTGGDRRSWQKRRRDPSRQKYCHLPRYCAGQANATASARLPKWEELAERREQPGIVPDLARSPAPRGTDRRPIRCPRPVATGGPRPNEQHSGGHSRRWNHSGGDESAKVRHRGRGGSNGRYHWPSHVGATRKDLCGLHRSPRRHQDHPNWEIWGATGHCSHRRQQHQTERSSYSRNNGEWVLKYAVVNRLRRRDFDRIKRSSVRIRPWPLHWVLGQGSLLPLSQGEAFTLASICYLAILVKYILAK